MKLGIITSHDAAGIERVRHYGLDYAEFDVNGDDITYLTNDAAVASILEAMKKNDVAMSAVGRWGRNRLNADGSVNEKEFSQEKELIDLCITLGCPVYISGMNYVKDISYFSNISAAIAYFQALIEYTAGKVKICTYNCDWNSYVNTPKAWELIHGHLPELGIKFDPSHTINGGRDYLREAVEWSSRFYHVHIKGTINVAGVHVDDPPAGLDMINWGAFLSILQHSKYDGVLSFEPHSETWQGELGEKGLEYSIRYIKKLTFAE
ncbi:MAG TPA: sugar phosphate isomerase/epimerase family protein [Bacillota bacterium]|nr:sugar phosphate isomerase/epimerase family protein [Bacillota bacterium]